MTSSPETLLCEYHYDPLDRLIGHGQPEVAKRQRFYCKSRLVTEMQGAESYSIIQHGNQVLAQQQVEGNTLNTTLLATDQQRSLLQALTANNLPQPIAYSPYGHRPVEDGLLSLLGFNGERPDPVSKHYLLGNGYRAFNPVIKRFNSPDGLSPFGRGGLNSYAYCQGDPINYIDPNGRWPKWAMFSSIRGTGMQKIRMIDDAAFTFIDESKGKIRFNIKAHGEPAATNQTSKIVFKDRVLSPAQLHSELKHTLANEQIDTIRILACHSADGGTRSFAAEFARLTKKPVKGYKGVVVANNDPAAILEQFNYSKQRFPGAPYKDLDEFFKNQIHHVRQGKSEIFHASEL